MRNISELEENDNRLLPRRRCIEENKIRRRDIPPQRNNSSFLITPELQKPKMQRRHSEFTMTSPHETQRTEESKQRRHSYASLTISRKLAIAASQNQRLQQRTSIPKLNLPCSEPNTECSPVRRIPQCWEPRPQTARIPPPKEPVSMGRTRIHSARLPHPSPEYRTALGEITEKDGHKTVVPQVDLIFYAESDIMDSDSVIFKHKADFQASIYCQQSVMKCQEWLEGLPEKFSSLVQVNSVISMSVDQSS